MNWMPPIKPSSSPSKLAAFVAKARGSRTVWAMLASAVTALAPKIGASVAAALASVPTLTAAPAPPPSSAPSVAITVPSPVTIGPVPVPPSDPLSAMIAQAVLDVGQEAAAGKIPMERAAIVRAISARFAALVVADAESRLAALVNQVLSNPDPVKALKAAAGNPDRPRPPASSSTGP